MRGLFAAIGVLPEHELTEFLYFDGALLFAGGDAFGLLILIPAEEEFAGLDLELGFHEVEGAGTLVELDLFEVGGAQGGEGADELGQIFVFVGGGFEDFEDAAGGDGLGTGGHVRACRAGQPRRIRGEGFERGFFFPAANPFLVRSVAER